LRCTTGWSGKSFRSQGRRFKRWKNWQRSRLNRSPVAGLLRWRRASRETSISRAKTDVPTRRLSRSFVQLRRLIGCSIDRGNEIEPRRNARRRIRSEQLPVGEHNLRRVSGKLQKPPIVDRQLMDAPFAELGLDAQAR